MYCQRAWWLGTVAGLEPTNRARLEQGIAAHYQHGTRVRLARVLLFASAALLCVALVSWWLG
jgi:Flp pilus assembly protein TadB